MFKLVSCKSGASRVKELALRLGPQGMRSSKCSRFIFVHFVVGQRDNYDTFLSELKHFHSVHHQ